MDMTRGRGHWILAIERPRLLFADTHETYFKVDNIRTRRIVSLPMTGSFQVHVKKEEQRRCCVAGLAAQLCAYTSLCAVRIPSFRTPRISHARTARYISRALARSPSGFVVFSVAASFFLIRPGTNARTHLR